MKKKQTEIIAKEMLQKGFETGIVTIENYYNGCIALCCKIGEYAFCFTFKPIVWKNCCLLARRLRLLRNLPWVGDELRFV